MFKSFVLAFACAGLMSFAALGFAPQATESQSPCACCEVCTCETCACDILGCQCDVGGDCFCDAGCGSGCCAH